MKEEVLHYIWQHKLFYAHNLMTTVGEPVEVIDVGLHNSDAGPDFFNAKVKVGDTLWAGNVEIHVKSSDWNRHNHTGDKAYNSVILHVVKEADTDVFSQNGNRIPQALLKYPEQIETTYRALLDRTKPIACADKLPLVPGIFIQSWKNALLVERLEQKTKAVEQLLQETNRHWEESFYITLARNFGFSTNGQAFEALAKSIPLSILGKHKDNLLQIEALLFGQSGLLPDTAEDDYTRQLISEYAFLRHKYRLASPLDASRWKLLRLRPANFPHLRIAQFASLVHHSSKLFSKILERPEADYLQELFACTPSEYWTWHYTFAQQADNPRTKKLGKLSAQVIIINTVVPFLFCYAAQKEDEPLKDKALRLLESLPAERNATLSLWSDLGMEAHSAYDSQALLQLKKHYCDRKACLHCRIGHKVLTIPQP